LRLLGEQVARIAADPWQDEKRELWHRHNRLEKVRPMVLVFPEDAWVEVIGAEHLQVVEPFWRRLEWYLLHLIYRHESLGDDFVIEPELQVLRVVRKGGWGVEPRYVRPAEAKGSVVWEAPLRHQADLRRLHYPEIEVDEEATQRAFDAVSDAFEDILPARIACPVPHVNLIGEATSLRGLEQVLLDMYDEPGFLHDLMGFIEEGHRRQVKYLEDGGYLTLNNGHHYNDSGGLGYTRELPADGLAGRDVELRDLWGFGVAQELSHVSPEQHEEFVLAYQLRLLREFGLNAYGCCEAYTGKFEMLKDNVPRLRRVSVSPWCDTERAARALQDEYIYSWKPNPAHVCTWYDPAQARKDIRQTLGTARGCVLEMVLKDTFTIQGDPGRLETWTRIAREEIDRSAGVAS